MLTNGSCYARIYSLDGKTKHDTDAKMKFLLIAIILSISVNGNVSRNIEYTTERTEIVEIA